MAKGQLQSLDHEECEAQERLQNLLDRRRRRREAWMNASAGLARAILEAHALHDDICAHPAERLPIHARMVAVTVTPINHSDEGDLSCCSSTTYSPSSSRACSPKGHHTSNVLERDPRRATWGPGDAKEANASHMPEGGGTDRCSSSEARKWSLAKAENLEATLAAYEQQLSELDGRTRCPSAVPLPSAMAKPSGGVWDLSVETASTVRLELKDLGCRLEDLAATALQTALHRNVPGAMDVFEQANAALDRLAEAIQRCSSAAASLDEASLCRISCMSMMRETKAHS